MNIKVPFKSTSELGRKMFQLLERNKFHTRQRMCSHDPSPQLNVEKRKQKGITDFQSEDEILETAPHTVCRLTSSSGKAQWSLPSAPGPGVMFRPACASLWPCPPITAARKWAKIITYLVGLSGNFLGDLYED